MRENIKLLILIILIITINFVGCKRERRLNNLTEANIKGREKLLEEVKITAHKLEVDQIKEVAQVVEGVILNEEHKPVSRISVILEKEDKRFKIPPQRTDSGGYFAFSKIPYGRYTLKLIDKGKVFVELNIEVDTKEKDVGIIYMVASESKQEIRNLEKLEEEVEIWEEEKIKNEEEFLAEEDKENMAKKEEISSKREKLAEKKLIIEKEISLSFHPNGLTWDGEYLWGVSKSYIHKISLEDGTCISRFGINILDGSGLAWDGRYLWCSDCFVDRLYKIDPKSERVVDMFNAPDPGYNHYGMIFDGEYLWYSSSNANFYKIDPQNGKTVASFLIEIGGCHNSLGWDGKYLWSTVWDRGMLYQINPCDGKVVREFVLSFKDPSGVVCIGENIWIASYYQKKIYKLRLE